MSHVLATGNQARNTISQSLGCDTVGVKEMHTPKTHPAPLAVKESEVDKLLSIMTALLHFSPKSQSQISSQI